MPRDGSDTRSTILRTAMRRFVEDGYDRTSLREIAEDVGVTKAALYYHFRTKEDIVRAATADFSAQLDALVDALADTPAGQQRTAAFVDGLLALVTSGAGDALRFGQANPTVMSRQGDGGSDGGGPHLSAVRRVLALLAGPDPAPEATVRATLAFGALMVGALGGPIADLTANPAGLQDAGRTVALELLGPLAADPAG